MKIVNGLMCADVPLRNYLLAHVIANCNSVIHLAVLSSGEVDFVIESYCVLISF